MAGVFRRGVRITAVSLLLATLGIVGWQRVSPQSVPLSAGFGAPESILTVGTVRDEELVDMDVVAGGDWVALLNTDGSIPGETNQAVDLLIARFGSDGELVWQHLLGSSIDDRGTSVELADSGDVWVSGDTFGALPGTVNQGERDGFLARYSAAGDLMWITQIATPLIERARDVAVTDDGTAFVVGTTYGKFPGQDNSGKSREAWIARISPSGDIDWIRQFGSTQSDTIVGVAIDDEGLPYVVGYTDGLLGERWFGGRDLFVARVSAMGEIEWLRQLGGPNEDFGVSISVSNAGVTIGGNTGTSAEDESEGAEETQGYVARLTRDGALEWEIAVPAGRCSSVGAIEVGSEDIVYIGGTTSSGTCDSNDRDALYAALYPDGTLRALSVVATAENDAVGAVAERDGRVWISGTAGSDGVFDVPTKGGWDGFVVRFPPLRAHAWVDCRASIGSATRRVTESRTRPVCPSGWDESIP